MCISYKSLGLSFGVALCIALPSVSVVLKYTNVVVVIAYLIAAFGLSLVGRTYILPKILPKLAEKQVLTVAVLVLAGTIAILAIVYPIANDPESFQGGSDADDALNITARELIAGNYPYYVRTYLDNPPRPMPGAILLALPFVVLLGFSAYQNLFWLVILFITARSYLKDGRSALSVVLMILALSPVVWHSVVTGIDLLANAIYVFVAIIWMINSVGKRDIPVIVKIASSVFLGIALSSRANYFLVVPIVFSALVQTSGWKEAAKYVAIAIATLTAITLPFYLYDPAGFSPLHVKGFLAGTSSSWSHAPLFITVSTGLITLLLSLFLLFHRVDNRYLISLGACALVQAVPVLFLVIFYFDIVWIRYGLSFMFFGCFACWAALEGRKVQGEPAGEKGPPDNSGNVDWVSPTI